MGFWECEDRKKGGLLCEILKKEKSTDESAFWSINRFVISPI